MLYWAYGFIMKIAASEHGQAVFSVGLIVASLNMLVQVFYSWVFGSKQNTKLRGLIVIEPYSLYKRFPVEFDFTSEDAVIDSDSLLIFVFCLQSLL